ncbi:MULTISPECIES: MFS transporter [Streptomyces]|uniref:MFS transporter n=1 Tax=Streptomyces TaxID=1883 RepID=UPI0001D06958|nr:MULTISPECIES: MFS transporter [Streptomyces]NED78277.1 MFS transporter [Streptomyces sp. SID9944]EFF91246.1 major facilitator family transporter [Streptomyces sp. e14]MBY8870106.1 MFS transporter [Streptomyces sennicomposti]NED34375.1 MFS transporter [Streptomyces sp. SID8499]NMO32717.1 MFS transporter [Streptomyces sp. GMY02]
MATAEAAAGRTVTTNIPARLDRLPWSRWHWTIVIGLGTVWILDGLEVTVVGNIASRLSEPGSGLSISSGQVTGVAAALYVAGACVGALFWGRLTDRYGRKKLFMITLAVYLAATALTAISFDAWWFFLFRFLTGFGIGGEYAAINSAIDELIPAEHRGRVDLIINGSFWIGAVGGSLLSILALNTDFLAANVGWRLTFALGAVLALVILLVRRHVPESPRWLLIHGRDGEAEEVVSGIEREVEREQGKPLPEPHGEITIHQRRSVSFLEIGRTIFADYPRRAVLGFSLFIGQAFLYNAITFGFGAILTKFFDVPSGHTGYYFAVIAVGNFLGPLLLGRLFDTVGRRVMISSTYLLSGLLLFGTAWLFDRGSLSATTLTACWCAVLFFASAGASSAYLTVSEIFPMETRAMSIAFFYALGTAAGGISGPMLFADLTGTGKVGDTVLAFQIGAGLMCAAGLVAAFLAVNAERRSLEDIATPLTAVPEKAGAAARGGGAATRDATPPPPSSSSAA